MWLSISSLVQILVVAGLKQGRGRDLRSDHVAAGVHAATVVRVRSPPIRRQRRPRSLSPLRSPPSAHELTLIATSAPPPSNRGTRAFDTF